MNARLYDPILHTFLSPDALISDPSDPQNYNRYAYALNNPLMYVDYSGNEPITVAVLITAAIIGAAVSATLYIGINLYNGTALTWGGLAKSIIVGAVSGMATAGIANIASSIFTAKAVGFLQGAYHGAVVGSITGASGVVINAALSGQSITLKAVLKGMATGAVIGGIVGGIQGGMRAKEGDASFWTGNKTLDTSKGVGAHTPQAQSIVQKGSIVGKYVGKYEKVNVYENSALNSPNNPTGSGGITLPPDTIIVGEGAYRLLGKSSDIHDLFMHEFGHILEYRQPFVGASGYYRLIAPESLIMSNTPYANTFWTETWANHLSKNYFYDAIFNNLDKYPSEPLSLFNLSRLLAIKIISN